MADLFTTSVLTAVVNSLQGIGPNSLTNVLFPTVQTETSEEIHFDVEADVMGLAPFVSPVVEGKVMSDLGFNTKTFKPAYVKPKHTWDGNRALKRYKGEQIGGNLSPADRQRLILADLLGAQRKMILNRQEWMAASVLTTGKVTISGDLYKTVELDFGRDAALTIAKAGGSKWGDSGIEPLDDLQDWADLVAQKSGSHPVDVVMEIGAWKKFRANTTVKERLNVQRRLGQEPTMSQRAIQRTGLTQVGTVDNFNIWLYEGFYKDTSGTIQRYLASGTVLLVGDMMGVQAYGAIKDEAAGYQALPYFTKSWIEEDPPVRFVMTQSAPLLVPFRPNASFCATVL